MHVENFAILNNSRFEYIEFSENPIKNLQSGLCPNHGTISSKMVTIRDERWHVRLFKLHLS